MINYLKKIMIVRRSGVVAGPGHMPGVSLVFEKSFALSGQGAVSRHDICERFASQGG
jgi:hypothetical protein